MDQALKREVSADVTTQPADNYNSGTADTNYILTNGVLLFHYQTDSNHFAWIGVGAVLGWLVAQTHPLAWIWLCNDSETQGIR